MIENDVHCRGHIKILKALTDKGSLTLNQINTTTKGGYTRTTTHLNHLKQHGLIKETPYGNGITLYSLNPNSNNAQQLKNVIQNWRHTK